MTTPRQPPAGPLEALPSEAGGADARSPEERAARILRDFEDERHCLRLADWLAIEIREAERAAESRGAKARGAERLEVIKILLSESCPCDEDEVCHCPQGRALAAMGLCGFLRHGSCTRSKGHKGRHDHWALIPRDAQRPSGSPSEFERGRQAGMEEAARLFDRDVSQLLAASRPVEARRYRAVAARIRALSAESAARTSPGSPSVPAAQPDRPEPPHSLPHTRCDCKGLWLQPWMVVVTTTDGASHARDSCSDQEGRPLLDPVLPRAAPTPALPREAPEPGGEK